MITDLIRFNYSTGLLRDPVPVHLHHYFQLDVILEGEVTVAIEGQKPVVGRVGDGWLIPALVRHGFETRKGYRQGSFKFHLAPRHWAVFNRGFRRQRFSPLLRELVEMSGARQLKHQPMAKQHALSTLTLCLIECLGHAMPPSTGRRDNLDMFRRLLWPLLERIAQDPYADWSITSMAAECHLSTDHFSKCFHRVLGMTPHRYLQENRLRTAAAEMMGDPPPAIKDVAEKVGYATVHAFARAFKQVFSVAPGVYRRSSQTL